MGRGAQDARGRATVAQRAASLRPLLDREWADELRVELRWAAQGLGELRELEVLIARLEERMAALPDDAVPEDPTMTISGGPESGRKRPALGLPCCCRRTVTSTCTSDWSPQPRNRLPPRPPPRRRVRRSLRWCARRGSGWRRGRKLFSTTRRRCREGRRTTSGTRRGSRPTSPIRRRGGGACPGCGRQRRSQSRWSVSRRSSVSTRTPPTPGQPSRRWRERRRARQFHARCACGRARTGYGDPPRVRPALAQGQPAKVAAMAGDLSGSGTSDGTVVAAGAVVWRPDPAHPGEVEVCAVHRPRYDDWSLPKGKLDRGEHLLAGGA